MATNGATSVNRPMDPKQRDADVNRKLQIYGIISAFQAGKVPSNEQIDVALNSFLASKALANPSKRLSPEGRALVADTQDVVKQARDLLLSKNDGNLLQDFIYQTTHFDPQQVAVPDAPLDKQTAKQHGDKAREGFRTLGTLIITNGQFRKLLKDATILMRDIGADAASNAASSVRPSEDKLAQIDRPADDNTWHDAPDLSKDNLKRQAQNVYKGDAKQDAKDIVNSGTSAAHPTGSNDPRDLARRTAEDQQYGTASGVDAVGGAQAAKNTLQQKFNEKVPDETKESANETAREYRRRTREYLKKKMPQDRREQTIWRLKKMVLECQQHPDYQQAISTLLDLAEEYSGHARTLTQGGTGTVQDTRTHMRQAESDLKTLIERFANGTSSDDLWESINQIYKDADKDPELKEWFKSLNRYVRRCLQQQGYILDEDSTHEWNRLYDQGNLLLRQKYRGHTDRIVDEIKFLGNQFDEDPQNKRFANSVQKLFQDLGNDQNGKPTFKKHLVKDLTDVILPAVMENIAYIPIPRIEYSDPQMDAVIENLVLESDNFMPNVMEISSENYLRWGRKKIANKNTHAFEVKVAGVQLDLKDVSYHIKRKQGFPSITDTGIVDVKMAGDGFKFKIKMSSADKSDRQHFFKVNDVDVDIKHLALNVKKSNHKLLFGLFKPIALKVIRPALQKALGKAIKDNFNKLDNLLYEVKLEADRAQEELKENPEEAPNMYSRYVNAAQKQIMQGKKKAEKAVADKKVNYAVTKEDSMFPNIHLPGGISSKATEYKELARKGDKWESPVFSIGSASKSTNLPGPPQITRKPHRTADPTNHISIANTNGAGYTGGPGYTAGQTGYGQTGYPTEPLSGAGYQTGINGAVPVTGVHPQSSRV